MKKVALSLLLASIILFTMTSPALAAVGQPPVAGCPAGFELHEFHDGDHHEHHVGLEIDLNGDGMICVRVTASGHHVHMDNVVR